jgi:hypothetical protein
MKLQKIVDIVLKVALSLLLVMPILGATGIFPAPTPGLYNTPQAFEYIRVMMDAKYVSVMMAVVFAIALVCLWAKREPLAALLILPITLNIVGFHLMLDGGLFKPGAIMGNVLLLLNVYLLWKHRMAYKPLIQPAKA